MITGTGKTDERHKKLYSKYPQSLGRCRGDRGAAHVYDDAGCTKTKLGNNNLRL